MKLQMKVKLYFAHLQILWMICNLIETPNNQQTLYTKMMATIYIVE